MKISFNEATTMKKATLEQDLEYCEKYGYDLIEIRVDKLRDYLTRKTLEDLANWFANHHLKPYSFNALEFFTFRDEQGQKEIDETFDFMCKASKVINCPYAIVVPTFDIGGYTIDEIRKETVEKLHNLANKADKVGLKLAFEFVGYPNCSVNTFGQAYDIIKEVNKDNVGLVEDAFHFHAMGSRWEDLENADGSKIFIFHLDDSEDLPIGLLRDDKRLWPGDGCIDVPRMFKTLKNLRFDYATSLELFRPEYYELEVEDCIRIGKEKVDAILLKSYI